MELFNGAGQGCLLVKMTHQMTRKEDYDNAFETPTAHNTFRVNVEMQRRLTRITELL